MVPAGSMLFAYYPCAVRQILSSEIDKITVCLRRVHEPSEVERHRIKQTPPPGCALGTRAAESRNAQTAVRMENHMHASTMYSTLQVRTFQHPAHLS